jgi:ubiquitin carboxyl-terminal hydrolase 5/13
VSPATGSRGTTLKAQRLASFPPYLAVCLNRYKLAANWAQVKVDAEVPVPLDLDLADLPERASFGDRVPSLRAWGGLQLGETAMIEGAAGVGGGVGEGKPGPRQRVAYDSDLVAQLVGMGFPDGACKRASAATASNGSGLDGALEWLAARMDDVDFGAEYVEERIASVPTSSASASSADVAVLTEMGFSEARAQRALRETQGSVERATDWLFSHNDDGMDEVEVVESSSASSSSLSNSGSTAEHSGGGGSAIPPSSSSRYTLLSIISHLGSNTASGHYVAHVRKVPGGKGAPIVTGKSEGG